jgi:hypothetical protein
MLFRKTYTPITHDITLEAELLLEETVDGLAVLASIRAVESVVGTLYGR